jgi:hypothetical protein
MNKSLSVTTGTTKGSPETRPVTLKGNASGSTVTSK